MLKSNLLQTMNPVIKLQSCVTGLLNSAITFAKYLSIQIKIFKMKKYVIIISLICVIVLFIGCEGAYVLSEPMNTESIRPVQPSPSHIWIDGDWYYNRQLHSYNRREGYWDMPRKGRTYQQGHWENNKKGHYWINGKWH